MKKEKAINEFVEGLEMTILPTEEQLLLSTLGGNDTSCVTNNCYGGNCASGCKGK